MKESGKAIVRSHVERIEGVNRTWFEWDWDHASGSFGKTLIVEVDCDTDPNCESFNRQVLDAIWSTVKGVLTNETTKTVSNLRIVPKDRV